MIPRKTPKKTPRKTPKKILKKILKKTLKKIPKKMLNHQPLKQQPKLMMILKKMTPMRKMMIPKKTKLV